MDVYFDDLAVGDKVSFGPYPVSREEAVGFAEKYDFQSFHLSDEAAAQTHFGRLAASGWHTCAMTMAMMLTRDANIPDRKEHKLGAIGLDELRWLKPVYPGDVLHGETEITEKIESKSRTYMGIVKSMVRVFNQDDELVMSFRPIVMWKRRPAE
ncbi:MAG: MaoC family dehydratase [Sphingobium sp.]